jgi:hypothetical protein
MAFVAQAEDWVHEPCVDWETTAVAYDEAYAQWSPPPCYTFSFTFVGLVMEPPNNRTVLFGQPYSYDDGRYGDLQTLDDFWNLYKEKCIQGCPTEGANSCSMEVNDDGFFHPTYLSMDLDSRYIHDAYNYRIEHVREVDCLVTEGPLLIEDAHEKKKDNKKSKKDKKKSKKGKKNKKTNKGKLLRKRGD